MGFVRHRCSVPAGAETVFAVVEWPGAPLAWWSAGLEYFMGAFDERQCLTPPESKGRYRGVFDIGVLGGLFCPEAGYVNDPQLSAHNLQRAAERLGAEFRFRSTVTGVHRTTGDRDRERVGGVTIDSPGQPSTRIDAPIVVNSAGCGAALKDYGKVVGTDAAAAFAERVVDANEWLASRIDRLPASMSSRSTVLVQDPCHLRHVQRIDTPVRTLLGHVADVVELDDDGLCCGAGGAYSALQPELASDIRDRKLASIDRAVAKGPVNVLASANPGCSMHLAAALADREIPVAHPVDIVARALGLAE